MPSVVNMKNIVNANNVSILGNDYSTYDLPVNSIDFNLKQKALSTFLLVLTLLEMIPSSPYMK